MTMAVSKRAAAATVTKALPDEAAPEPLVALQQRLGHRFAHPHLLQLALTHRSFSAQHNERLEFLGDSVLNLAVSALLYRRLQVQPEGDLSRIRAHLVRQETLHALALELGLPALLRLGAGEERSGGRARASILADALEALIGAVYLDAGFASADALVQKLLAEVDFSPGQQAHGKDAKTALQEWLQGRKLPLPEYTVVATHGQAHKQTFEVRCSSAAAAGVAIGSALGCGATRRAAEQAAAAALLQRLQAAAP